jgi:hypothetical protein
MPCRPCVYSLDTLVTVPVNEYPRYPIADSLSIRGTETVFDDGTGYVEINIRK